MQRIQPIIAQDQDNGHPLLPTYTLYTIPSLDSAGRTFRPVSSDKMYKAVAELCKGSSPLQLAKLEGEVQQHFKAPSFAALGHGASLLQLCGQDESVMKLVTSAGRSVAPLTQVMLLSR